MPEAEAALLRAEYARAGVVLEYGSGGSTVLAGEQPGKAVFSVESDHDWAQMMRGWFVANPPAQGASVDVIWSDIGETRDWGHPATDAQWRRWPRYPLEVWGRSDFRQPDVVLVDGRFRVGCALAAAFLSDAPLVLLFDDYARRKHYHKVEQFLGQPQLTGRMARFDITPQPIPPGKLLRIIEWTMRP
ncbi:hypothetical protein AL036_17865 [Salipiger aestuarii]|uniref:Methyltransferase family protein n=2 Tax=Salipiger aestuarii TaxID=568098 RepID=A0A327XRS9_9RHOB|nr:hypothetical protein [Salipiger aestuarii]KAA8605666.1 hypothetical protein AL036_17865 [Salipiger aestuarii]KAA8612925.1 hypothetical protein AL037_06815 [Salipiger aestuarii]KAB2539848.1 hypothetical protein AL035_17555 [Salipiger aestuarii]RAK10972.1 hypothetical protein ATI53_10538 [Salipiger aestuarii]